MAHSKTDKPRILRWHGILKDREPVVRRVAALVLAIACAALSFTQLGFAGIGTSGAYTTYIIILLLPIALGALLLGTFAGTLLGVMAGAVLYWHAKSMPLDSYELSFITPASSILMLGMSGFLLGLLFAFALRNDPTPFKRVIYITIVCFIVSLFYSLGFIADAIRSLVVDIATNYPELANATSPTEEMQSIVEANTMSMALRLGNVGTQIWVDALLMAVFCIAVDVLVRKIRRVADNLGLRSVFASWLAVVVLIAFMATSAVSFAIITQSNVASTAQSMKSEVGYLKNQISNAGSRADSILAVLDSANIDHSNLDEKSIASLLDSLSIGGILDGYTKEDDGTILLLVPAEENAKPGESEKDSNARGNELLSFLQQDYVVALSDDEGFKRGEHFNNLVDDDMTRAILSSLDSGKIQRAIFDNTHGLSVTDAFASHAPVSSEIVYLYAEKLDNDIILTMKPARMVFGGRDYTMAWTTLSTVILLIAVFGMVFQLLNRVVARRIEETNTVLGRITDGDLNARIDVSGTREFKTLSNDINTTVDTLKGWIAEAETRMDTELATAKAIQESALPRTFPPYPDILKFDIYASMQAAREVGGDFYDFFLIGDDSDTESGRLGFVMADVSGKGIPAALFMMKAMAQIRDYLQSGMEIGEAVENANRQLVDGNDAGMFVTAWVGVLDYGTGHVDFVNAGHNPPLLWQKKEKWHWVTEKSGMPLGLFDGLPYDSHSIECEIGDEFLLYTDGVTEAMNVEGELYGEERLIALVSENFTLHPRTLVNTVRHDVSRHAKGAEQSDDITILALEVGVPPELTKTFIVPADDKELPHVNNFVHDELDRRLCPKRTQNQLDIAVEELFVNVCHYAYPDATPEDPGTVRISCTYSAEPPSVVVCISDDGIPYDPLAKPDAVTPDNIADVPIGGLGILMAKRNVDEMRYERIDGSNVVTIVKKW